MRKYRNIEPERWRAILGLLRWQLSLRVAGLERARTWGAALKSFLPAVSCKKLTTTAVFCISFSVIPEKPRWNSEHPSSCAPPNTLAPHYA